MPEQYEAGRVAGLVEAAREQIRELDSKIENGFLRIETAWRAENEELDARVKSLETSRAEAKGALWLLSIGLTVAQAIGLTVFGWWLSTRAVDVGGMSGQRQAMFEVRSAEAGESR